MEIPVRTECFLSENRIEGFELLGQSRYGGFIYKGNGKKTLFAWKVNNDHKQYMRGYVASENSGI